MNFKKDLLLVDLETTGLDAARHEIIQLAAVLLDRKTLREKTQFNAYLRPEHWASRDLESMAVNKIVWGQVKRAPKARSVIRKFNRIFHPKRVVLAYYGGPVDMDFLRAAYNKAGIKWRFDYHFFNLWAVFYAYLGSKSQLKNSRKHTGFTLEDLTRKFKIKVEGARHDALFDCRVEAEILRKIMKDH